MTPWKPFLDSRLYSIDFEEKSAASPDSSAISKTSRPPCKALIAIKKRLITSVRSKSDLFQGIQGHQEEKSFFAESFLKGCTDIQMEPNVFVQHFAQILDPEKKLSSWVLLHPSNKMKRRIECERKCQPI